MSRFSGRDTPEYAPTPDIDPEVEVQDTYDVSEDDTITVGVKAFLSFSLYVQSVQLNRSRMILVTGTERIGDTAEKFIGVDGETGEAVEVTVSYPQ